MKNLLSDPLEKFSENEKLLKQQKIEKIARWREHIVTNSEFNDFVKKLKENWTTLTEEEKSYLYETENEILIGGHKIQIIDTYLKYFVDNKI